MTENDMGKSTKRTTNEDGIAPAKTDALPVHARLARDERRAALRALAGRLAHQLRNPLAAVRAACRSVREETDDPDQRETLDLTLTEIERMLSFVHATVQRAPGSAEAPQAVDVVAEVADVIEIVESGHANPLDIVLSGDGHVACNLPRNSLRVSVYSVLEDLIGSGSTTEIGVHVGCADGQTVIRFALRGVSTGDPALSNGMIAPVSGFQPVGLLVAERFARDLGGRLSRSDDGDTQTVALELSCSNV